VTCGDIGTTPVEVERQLTFALGLGKAWDCGENRTLLLVWILINA